MEKLHNFYAPALAVHNSHRTLPEPDPHPPTLRRWCDLRSADLQPQGLIKLQFRNRVCIRPRQVSPQNTTRFRRKACCLVKL